MPLHLSPYIGNGTREDPFMPRGLDQPGASAIDLRIDCTRADGGGIKFALLWVPSGIPDPIGPVKLADDHGETVSTLIKNAANTRFGLDFSKDITIQDLVETILLRPDNGHWHRLRPNKGRVEAWLGSGSGKRRWVDFPVLAGGTIATDDFNRADENPLAGNWTSVSVNPFRIISNQVHGSGAGGDETYAYWNADTFGNDQFSQIQIVTANVALGVTVRGSGASVDYYCVQDYPNGYVNPFKYVAGAYTSLDTQPYAWPTGDYLRLAVSGSTLTVYGDAGNPPTTQLSQVTDTTFVSGKVGIYDWDGAAVLDNWSGGDVTAADTTMAAAVTLSLSASAPLVTAITMAGPVACHITTTALLTTAITCRGGVTLSLTGTAGLVVGANLAASILVPMTTTGVLQTGITCAGAAAVSLTMTGALADSTAVYSINGMVTRLYATVAAVELTAPVRIV